MSAARSVVGVIIIVIWIVVVGGISMAARLSAGAVRIEVEPHSA